MTINYRSIKINPEFKLQPLDQLLIFTKRRSGRALIARRQTIWRRVLRHGALRAVGGKSRGVVCSALFERVFTWFCGDAAGSVLSLPELNWCYPIRRRGGGNAGVYLGMS